VVPPPGPGAGAGGLAAGIAAIVSSVPAPGCGAARYRRHAFTYRI
jgi:hypothetical protein